MKLLAEITEHTLGIGSGEVRLRGMYELRKSARVVLENERGEIALQHLTEYGYYKLPGGGIEAGESPEEAAVREVREEVGAQATIVRPLGIVIEYRNTLLHISYAYHARVGGMFAAPQLEAGEIEEGQETVWLSPAQALGAIQSGTPKKYEGHFIVARERAFLNKFLSSVN